MNDNSAYAKQLNNREFARQLQIENNREYAQHLAYT